MILVAAGVLLSMTCAGVLGLGLLLPPLAKAQRNARSMKDAAQLKALHSAFVVYSREYDGRYPLPSLRVLAEADDPEGAAEDFSLNHSAALYSMLIMDNYVTPQLLVSPVEVAAHVRVKDGADPYDWSAYDPAGGVYWDPTFVMHVHDPAVGANGSYAHLAAVGDRRTKHWRRASNPAMPIVGTRGPRPGWTPPGQRWVGNVCFDDNHTERIENFYPPQTTFESSEEVGGPLKDNIFAADSTHPMGPHAAADAFLAVYIAADQWSVEDVYDPIE